MAGEEAGLFAKLQASGQVLSPFGTLFSIGSGIYGMVESNKNWAEVNRKLDQIQESLKVIQQRVDNLFAESQMTQLVVQLTDPADQIIDFYKRLLRITTAFKNDRAKFYREWATKNYQVLEDLTSDVLKEQTGVPHNLRRLSNVLDGTAPFKSLIEAVVAKIKYGGGGPDQSASRQSQYYDAIKYFEKWLLIQQKAIICLGNAYLYRDPENKGAAPLVQDDVTNWNPLIERFRNRNNGTDANTRYIFGLLDSSDQYLLLSNNPLTGQSLAPRMITKAFNKAIEGPVLYAPGRIQNLALSPRTQHLVENATPTGGLASKRLNRTILTEAFNEIPWSPSLTDAVAYIRDQLNDPETPNVPKLQAQATFCKTFVDRLDKWYQDKAWGGDEGSDFVCFSNEVFTWDTNEVMADDGKVVVGLRFVRMGPRVGLEISQCAFSTGKVTQAGDTWKGKPNVTDYNYFSVLERSDNGRSIRGETDDHYVDMCEVTVPDGRVVVGAALEKKGNRAALRLAGAALDAAGNVDKSTLQWYRNPRYEDKSPADYVELRIWRRPDSQSSYRYGPLRGVSLRAAQPEPRAPISGARMCCYGLDQGLGSNRIVLAVRPGLVNKDDLWQRAEVTNIEDVWRKYDVTATALATVLAGGQQGALGTGTR